MGRANLFLINLIGGHKEGPKRESEVDCKTTYYQLYYLLAFVCVQNLDIKYNSVCHTKMEK